MSGAFFNLWRLARVARVLARHDALAALEGIGAAPPWLTPDAAAGAARRARKTSRGGARRRRCGAGPRFHQIGSGAFHPGRSDRRANRRRSGAASRSPAALSGGRGAGDGRRRARRAGGVAVRLVRRSPRRRGFHRPGPLCGRLGRRPVAVKVLRPGIERAFRRDLELFLRLARAVERCAPAVAALPPRRIGGGFRRRCDG